MTQQITRWLGRAAILAVVLGAGLGGSTARAQFGLSINTPGASVGIGTGAYGGGYYPAAPVVVAPPPVVYAPPPVVYAPQPYYGGGGYGPRPFYGPGYPPRPYGYNYNGGGHHGPYPGPHYGPYGTPYRRF